MIYYSEDRIKIYNTNIFEIPVEREDGGLYGYVYVSRETYDAAVTLSDRFEGDYESVASNLVKDKEITHDLQEILDLMPAPLDILVPYVLLCKDGLTDITFESVCGALTVMSRSISFKQFIVVPEVVRSGVTFTRYMLSQYNDIWDMMFNPVTVMDLDTYTKDFVTSLCAEIMSRLQINQNTSTHIQYKEPQTYSNMSMFEEVDKPSTRSNDVTLTKEEVSALLDATAGVSDVNEEDENEDEEIRDEIDFNAMFEEFYAEEEAKKKSNPSTQENTNDVVAEAETKLDMQSTEDKGYFDIIKYYSRSVGR